MVANIFLDTSIILCCRNHNGGPHSYRHPVRGGGQEKVEGGPETSYSVFVRGEEGYYFTNLCCALNFVETLTAASLNLPQHEFDSFMNGEIPPGSWGSTLMPCEGIQSINTSLASLKELSDIQDKIMSDCDRLERDMEAFQSHISSEVERVLAKTQYTIREPKKPVTVDALSPQVEESLLPPPLVPTNLTSSSESLDKYTSSPPPPPSSAPTHSSHTDLTDSGAGSHLSSYVGFSAQSASIPVSYTHLTLPTNREV